MSLASGTRLGPYEIQSAIGAGGMGEVYKARDTRLDRTVAIKVLPADVSADPERRARFEREAKTVAGLNHAHICTLHDVGDHEGAMFLVARPSPRGWRRGGCRSSRTLAFIGVKGTGRNVYLRDLDSDTARPLDGTDGARSLAFSPGGEWMAFSTRGEIRKVRVGGGPTARLCEAEVVDGLTWGSGRLVYASDHLLLEVPPDGGTPRTLVDSTRLTASPQLLPGDTAVLYTEHQKRWTSGDEDVMILPLTPGGAPRVLVSDAADARYLPTGHLAFLRQGTLSIVPFDATTLRLGVGEVAVLKDVAQAVASWYSGDLTLAGQWAVSAEGTLAYVARPTVAFPSSELVSIDRSGHVTPLPAPAMTYRERIEPSPKGTSVVVSVQTTRNVGLFLYDPIRDTLTPVPVEANDAEAVWPVWSTRGVIAFCLIEGGVYRLRLFDPDAPSQPEVVGDPRGFYPSAWSPDGQRVVGSRIGMGYDLWVYSMSGKGEQLTPLLQTQANERHPAWSPDGQWLAYTSDASGRQEVFVQPYPGPGKRIQISPRGGRAPAWNPKGRELFYVEEMPPTSGQNRRMMVVNMTAPFAPGKPTPLFSFESASLPLAACNPTNCYSVAPDGQRFFGLRMLPRARTPVTHLNLIQNWFEELKAKVPVR